jgi:hypothetical protein
MATKSWIHGVLLQILCLIIGLGTAFGAMELPSKLKEVPLYSGSKIIQVMDMGTGSMATLSVKASRDALLDFYRQKMKANEWKIAFQAEQEDSAVIHFSKGKQMIQLSVQKGETEGDLQYNLLSVDQ